MPDDTSREVERKFLLESPPDGLDEAPRKKVRQGYLAVTRSGTEVRVRKRGKSHTLTIKEGHGADRGETEVGINPAQFACLWPMTKGKRVRKTRYSVNHDGHTLEVDVYRGKLKGLITAEVEFPDDDASRKFQPPAWLGREVTGDEGYSNQNLARNGLPKKEDGE